MCVILSLNSAITVITALHKLQVERNQVRPSRTTVDGERRSRRADSSAYQTKPEWVARRACERRRLLLSRRDDARLVVGTSPGPAIARMFDTELRVLTNFGFAPVQALRAIISIGHYVTGFAMEEQAEQQQRDGKEGAR